MHSKLPLVKQSVADPVSVLGSDGLVLMVSSGYHRHHLAFVIHSDSDLFAIPDFPDVAMENWGLITFDETELLYNEESDPANSRQRVALVIAHELAHQVRQGEWGKLDNNC